MDAHENKDEAAQSSTSGQATGPRTAEGKAKASQNARKHGLFSSKMSFGDAEEQAEFDKFVAELKVDRKAKGLMQEMVVEQIAECLWQLDIIQSLFRQALQAPDSSPYAAALAVCFQKLDVSSDALDGGQHNTTAGDEPAGSSVSAQESNQQCGIENDKSADQGIPTVTRTAPPATDLGKFLQPFGCEQVWVRMTSGDHTADHKAQISSRRGTGTVKRELGREDHGVRGQYELELRIPGPMQTLMRYQATVSRQVAQWFDLLARLQGRSKPINGK
jgi:hypothetical protein